MLSEGKVLLYGMYDGARKPLEFVSE
jgi:hypothetical protein